VAQLSGPEDPAEKIVLRAMSRDASLEEEVARLLAARVLDEVAAGVDPSDAPELARRLLAAEPVAGASLASVVAAAASEVLEEERAAEPRP
jgi:hypothetical protein